MKKILQTTIIIGVVLALPVPTNAVVAPPPACKCIIPTSNISGNSVTPGSGGIIDDRSANLNYMAPNSSGAACHYACQNNGGTGGQPLATMACQKLVPNGTEIWAFSKPNPGFPPPPYNINNTYVKAKLFGKLINTPATTTTVWKCPTGWFADNQPGDITTNGRCKRLAGHITVPTLPANGAQIILPPTANGVQWGFTWGNEIWVWSSPANGGMPVATPVTTPAVCKF